MYYPIYQKKGILKMNEKELLDRDPEQWFKGANNDAISNFA